MLSGGSNRGVARKVAGVEEALFVTLRLRFMSARNAWPI